MSYGKVFVYVMAPHGAEIGPSKIGTTVNLSRRRNKIRRMFKDQWRCLPRLQDSEYFWIAEVQDYEDALYIESRVKARLGRKYQHMNDWMDHPPSVVAETVASLMDWMLYDVRSAA
jgi:predicted GIY-YIG superfamily endonuclease